MSYELIKSHCSQALRAWNERDTAAADAAFAAALRTSGASVNDLSTNLGAEVFQALRKRYIKANPRPSKRGAR